MADRPADRLPPRPPRSRLGRYTRRGFLIASAAVAGGVAFGTWQTLRALPNPLQPAEGAVALNPWLIIDAAGVTVVAPRAEMGQGIHTTLAAMVAEELDADWSRLRVIHGPGAPVYYNGAAAAAALPFADYAKTPFQHHLAGALDVLPKMLALQVTGGSTSTVDGFDRMRLAGATAREVLLLAAAMRLNLAPAALRTANGMVIAPDGTSLSYGELAADAADLPVPEVTLRPQSRWRLLGRGAARVDMLPKATGTAQYGIDTRLPGMVFATVRMNPRRDAPMLSHDPAPALAMPGVHQVIDLGTGIAVVARNTWIAFQAAEAVPITWGEATYPPDTEGIFSAITVAFEARANSALRDDGDVAGALAAAPGPISAEYRVPYLAHATMEPMNATALYSGDSLQIWCGNQAPLILAQRAAEAVGLAPGAVEVETPLLGGGFGRRVEPDVAVLAARVAQAMPGVPVQVTWRREEDMQQDYYRPGAVARMQGAVAGGLITAFDAQIAAPSVTRQTGLRLAGFAPPGADKGHVEGAFDQPYAIPAYRVRGYLADVAVPVGFWRSVGNSFNGFFHESFIDELAHAAGADPLAFRLAHVRPAHFASGRVLEEVGAMAGWDTPKAPGTGRGVALTYSFGTAVAQVVEVADQGGDMRITRAWIACDTGVVLDPAIVKAQMVSGLIFGLSAAVMGEITFANGSVEQGNFWDYDALRMHTAPAVEVRLLHNNKRMGGAGEPGTPPAAPALANALYDLTGVRARELPLRNQFSFVA